MTYFLPLFDIYRFLFNRQYTYVIIHKKIPHVSSAKPEGLKRCEVTDNSVLRTEPIVSCIPGWNGGMNQTFTLEVLKSRSVYSRPLAMVQESSTPIFNLKELEMDQEYLLILTAVNSQGVSPPFTLTYKSFGNLFSTSTPDAYASKQNIAISWSIFIAMLTGVFLTIFVCLIAIFYLIKVKSRNRNECRGKYNKSLENNINVANANEASNSPGTVFYGKSKYTFSC